jgi:hypothetical protein
VDYTAAQRHELQTLQAQHMLAGMSDNPQQFRGEDPMSALLKQCWREKYGHSGGMDYMTVKF